MKRLLLIFCLVAANCSAGIKSGPGFFSLRPHSPHRKTDENLYGASFRFGGGRAFYEQRNAPLFFGGMHFHFKFIGLDYTGYIGRKTTLDPILNSNFNYLFIKGRSIFLGYGYYTKSFSLFAGIGQGRSQITYDYKIIYPDNSTNWGQASSSEKSLDFTLKLTLHTKSVGFFLQTVNMIHNLNYRAFTITAGIEFGQLRSDIGNGTMLKKKQFVQ